MLAKVPSLACYGLVSAFFLCAKFVRPLVWVACPSCDFLNSTNAPPLIYIYITPAIYWWLSTGTLLGFFLLFFSFWCCSFSLMEVECVALKDLTSPRKSSTAGSEEDGGETEQKVRWPGHWILGVVWALWLLSGWIWCNCKIWAQLWGVCDIWYIYALS